MLFDGKIFHAVSFANYTSNAKTGSIMLCLRLNTNVYLNSQCGFRLFGFDKQIMC